MKDPGDRSGRVHLDLPDPGGRSLESQDYQIGILGDGGRKIGDGHIRLLQRKPDGSVVVRAISDPPGGLTGRRYQTNRINLGK